MGKTDKHYRFINSKTGNTIYYHTLKGDADPVKINQELEKIKTHVATENGIYYEVIYWEEIKRDS
jgi:hypothetical protein